MEEVINNILASLYLFMWVATLIWYQRKSHFFDSGSLIITLYIIYGVFSLFSINDALFAATYKPLRLFPYVYLYLMMIIAMSPVIYIHFHTSNKIKDPNTRIFEIISVIIIVCSLILLPNIIANFGNGVMKLFTDVDAGNDAYKEQIEEAGDGGSGISNLPAILYNALSDIAVFLFFYYLTFKKKNLLLIIGLAFSIVIGILMPIMNGQRGGVIISVLTSIGGYFMFRRYLSTKINKALQITGISFVIIISLPVAAITVSRFGKMNAGVTGFLNWYVGQGSLYFNNSALNAGGTRNGDRTMNIFKRMIDSNTPKNYSERRDKYHNLEIDDNIFSTFVGDFTIDFGPVAAVIIFIAFNTWVLFQVRPRDGTIKVDQLLLLFFVVCVSVQGGMSLFSYSDTSNFRIIMFMSLYMYLRYHEVLLDKFPLENKSEDDKPRIID